MTLLQITNLTIENPKDHSRLVDAISWSINAGERLGLIGESGSGKSLTTLAVMGLLPPTLSMTGSINYAGAEIFPATDATLRKIRGKEISIVFQDPTTSLDPLMKIKKQVAEPLERHFHLSGQELESQVHNLLEEVALSDITRIANSFPHQISGGEKQRVSIAMALACKPKLLIADEPTTALDVTIQSELLTLLRDLANSRSMSLLLVSHDLAVVSQIVDRILVMKAGVIVETGTIAEIMQYPSHPYTRSLLENARRLDSALGNRI